MTYNGIIYANAQLEFYPASFRSPARRVADVVAPLPDTPGGAVTLNTTASQLTQIVNLPRNTEAAYLDVFAQSQYLDEFWYTCAPNDVAGELFSCGNTAFRETEITVDGQPAGVAPVYPWVYTGGIDPYLWAPIPGVQTLNFKPFRVNLTPFAGLLADGQPHTVALSVFNADHYFLATANLLVFTDHHADQVTGGVLSNTLAAAPTPVVTENLKTGSGGTITGTVAVQSARDYAIKGFVNTSHGRVETTVAERSHFRNAQTFIVSATQYLQDIAQNTITDEKVTTRDGFGEREEVKHYDYPFAFNINQLTAKDGTITAANVASQKYLVNETERVLGYPVYHRETENEVKSQDTDIFTLVNGNYALTSHFGQKSEQVYRVRDSRGECYARELTAKADVLTGVEDGEGCEGEHEWK